MPRPKKPGQEEKEVKKRSRNGCWPCKGRKVKCGEEKPHCVNCQRQGETCDYDIRLNWDGRTKKKKREDGKPGSQPISFEASPSMPREATPVQLGNGFDSTVQHNQSISGHSDAGSMRAVSPFTSVSDRGINPPPQVEFMGKPPIPSPAFDSLQPGPPFLRQPSWQDAGIGTFQGMASMPPLRSHQQPPSYPSPADSSFGSPHTIPSIFNMNGQSMQMPPPFPTSNLPHCSDVARSPNGSNKRVKLSPREEAFGRLPNRGFADSSYGTTELEDPRSSFQSLTPSYFQPHLSNPLTPAASSTTSDDLHNKWMPKMSPKVAQATQETEVRRVSVNSLLSGSPEPEETRPNITSQAQNGSEQSTNFTIPQPPALLHHRTTSSSQTETYGMDRGLPDIDLPRNNDTGAISGVSPSEHSELDAWLNGFELAIPEFGFGLPTRDTVFAKGGYYASPVPIKIPLKLEPLPPTLLENPMNLLYFHHFLNHTARILVPHDCSENPFKTILPKMAVENTNLLHLLLAYSASHRARLLSHPEPANRIALWVRDVFPSLRHALDDLSHTEISNANLATAIMLASLEIISPSTFGVSVPWQNHLSIARSIIKCRGGPKSVSRKDPVTFFLTRWLAYLDVLGSLSGRRNEEPLFGGNYWRRSSTAVPLPPSEREIYGTDDENDFTIDCLLGFTTRCVSILARIATLARECEWQRIDSATGKAKPEWQPPREISEEADELRADLENSRVHPQPKCSQHVSSDPENGGLYGNGVGVHEHDEGTGLEYTNAAFHWAGQIHLLRRIYNLPRSHEEVQYAVRQIVEALQQVPQGGNAEACLLFPMFTAGVEAEDQSIRDTVLGRIKGVEEFGMCQVGRARALMEEVWKTGKEWEGLVQGEFFG